mmetsp:Transcript_19945/g.28666  ORF Transcript_19945/g.28666 Transcript_19945/m.28666 type:complete len:114 (-) Transcript_19945:152-493(-)
MSFCSLPGCNQPADKRCSKCKKTYYCSRSHQTDHWSTHKSDCKTFAKTLKDNDDANKSNISQTGEMRSCRCMFCGEALTLSSEEAAVEHMKVCPALQEQLNDDKQFTLPESMR